MKYVSEQLTLMKKDADNSEFWLGYETYETIKKARNFMDNVDQLTDLCVYKEKRNFKPYIPQDNDEDSSEDLDHVDESVKTNQRRKAFESNPGKYEEPRLNLKSYYTKYKI